MSRNVESNEIRINVMAADNVNVFNSVKSSMLQMQTVRSYDAILSNNK